MVAMLCNDLVHALDPVVFARDVGKLDLDPKQCAIVRSRSKYLIRCTSRQWGKSTTFAVKGAHRAYYDGTAFIIIASPTQRQSDETFFKLQSLVRSKIESVGEEAFVPADPNFEVYGRQVGSGRRVSRLKLSDIATEWKVRSLRLKNGARVISLPGAPENIRGYAGVTDAFIDEAAFIDDALLAAVRPMLRVRRGALWLASTPNGQQGEFYRIMSAEPDHWDRDTVTVDDNPRINPEDVAIDRKELPSWLFDQEYYCRFTERLGSVFAERDIQSAMCDVELLNL